MTLGLSKAEADRTDVFLARFMELPCILYSSGLSCCIQFIVGLHPRLDLKIPNARLNDQFSNIKAMFYQNFELKSMLGGTRP